MLEEYFTLNVDRECIDKGVVGDAGSCPVSLALKNVISSDYEVLTSQGGYVSASDKTEDQNIIFRFENDGMLNTWLCYYDEHLDVESIEIYLTYNSEDGEIDEDGNMVYEGEATIVDSSWVIGIMESYDELLYLS